MLAEKRVLGLAGVLLVLMGAMAIPAGAESFYRNPDERDNPVVDMPFATRWELDSGYVFPAETTAAGWEDLSAVEIGAWARFGNWESEYGLDFDLSGHWDTMLVDFSAEETDVYPLTMARVALEWTQRFENGGGLAVDAEPGLYSGMESFEGDDFSVPFGFTGSMAVNPSFAWLAGLSVYPTFDQVVDPRLGVRLAHRDNVILDIAYPETRLVLSPVDGFRVSAGIQVKLWPEYNMGDDPRERLQYDEIRASGALEFAVGPALELSLQGGYLMEREMAFESGGEDVEIEDAPFAKLGLNGRF